MVQDDLQHKIINTAQTEPGGKFSDVEQAFGEDWSL